MPYGYQTPGTGTNQLWQTWTTSTATVYYPTYSNQVWATWTNTGTTGVNTTLVTYQNEAWNSWTYQPYQPYVPKVETSEEIAAREARVAVYEAQQAERQKRLIVARTRARTLLDEFLDVEQQHELTHQGRFHVVGSRGRRYCIRAQGQSGNVDVLNADGTVQARLCVHPTVAHDRAELLPEADAWLCQMLAIQDDEDKFLRTANVHAGSRPAMAVT